MITNVPGPREPLYLGTAKLLDGYGTAPVLDGLGLILVVTSYLDTLTISATAAHEAVPDIERLVEGIHESFVELRDAVADFDAGSKTGSKRRASSSQISRPKPRRAHGAG